MNLLASKSGRRVLFASLYLSEGAPIGYVWWALPTRLRAAEVPIEQVTALTAMLVLPWTLKFLWAPLIDTVRGPRWGYRSWIIAAQLGMGLMLVPLLWLPIADSLSIVTPLLVAHAIFAATQDVSVDAFCIASVPPSERGGINGWMQFGMLLGRATFGGAALYLEQWWGEQTTILLMLGCIWGSMLLVGLTRSHQDARSLSGTARSSALAVFGEKLKLAFSRRATWLGLLFAAAGGAAFEAVGAMAGPILIDEGISRENVGLFFAGPVVIGMACGALVGGFMSDRLGRRRSVAMTAALILGSVLAVAVLLWIPERSAVGLYVALGTMYLLIGAFTATSYALFMDLTDPALGATQFSAYMGATNLCEVWAGFTAGQLAAQLGYAAALIIMVGGSAIGLLPLRWLKVKVQPILPKTGRGPAQSKTGEDTCKNARTPG